MQRRHLVELHERPECPAFVRDSVVEALGRGLRWLGLGAVIGPAFAAFCRDARCERVLELCSGTGEPVALLLDWLRAHGEWAPPIVLSDRFPHLAAMAATQARHPAHVAIEETPVDATAVPARIPHDARLVINAFHHFAPADAARIIADTVASRRSLFLYEGFPRDLARFLPTGPATLPALLLNPLLASRDRLAKAVFTYLAPIIPMVAMWDGIVSVLRIHDEPALTAMTAGAGDYRWAYREVPYGLGGRAVVFTGIPLERL
jgi:hypothetical protein